MKYNNENIASRKTLSDGSTKITWEGTGIAVTILPRFSQALADNRAGETGGYLLFDPVPSTDGKIPVYVGASGQSGVFERIRQHDRKAPDETIERWLYAITVTGSTNPGESATIDMSMNIEWALHRLFASKEHVSLVNKQNPSGARMLPDVIDDVTNMAEAALEIMRPFADPGQSPRMSRSNHWEQLVTMKIPELPRQPVAPEVADSETKKKTISKVKVSDLIAAGLLDVGDKLIGSLGQEGTAHAVVVDTEGRIELLHVLDSSGELMRGFSNEDTIGNSPSSKELFTPLGKDNPPNGWTFWLVDKPGSPSLSDLQRKIPSPHDQTASASQTDRMYTLKDHPKLFEQPTQGIFEAFESALRSLDARVAMVVKKNYVSYKLQTGFVNVFPLTDGIKLIVNLKFNEVEDPQKLCLDVSSQRQNGEVAIKVSDVASLDYAMTIVRQAFKKQIN